MKIVFFGSDDFAAVHLTYLVNAKYQVVACVTQPDSRQGRGLKVMVSPIKEIAQQYHIPYLQPVTFKDPAVVQQLKEFQADIFAVVAYGRLLSQEILDIPKIFCVNVHGSLLPKYRGAAPINWAILNGDQETGVTVQKMALALDAGDIIAQARMPISDDINAQNLREAMAYEGAQLLNKTLENIRVENFTLTPQIDAHSSYACKLTKEMGRIDWSKNARSIFNQVRGLQPWPGSYTRFQGKTLKILNANVLGNGNGTLGEVIGLDRQGIIVACGQGALQITHVHLEASKPMPAASFIAGHHLRIGDSLC